MALKGDPGAGRFIKRLEELADAMGFRRKLDEILKPAGEKGAVKQPLTAKTVDGEKMRIWVRS